MVDLEVDPTADLILLPDTITDALARMARLRQPLEIGCVVALGGLDGATDLTISSVVGALRLRAKPWGMAIADLGATSVDVWISNLLTNLTHDATLDVALRASLGGDRWLLLAEPVALEAARVSRTAARLAAAIGARGPVMAPLPAIVPELLGVPLDASMGVLAMAAADPGNFREETRGATATAAMADALAADRRRRPVTGPPRWIQAEIREGETFKGRPRRTSLAPATLYGVDVWVGPETTGIHAEEAFPDEELPRDGRTHRLTVVFTELDGARRTTTGHVNLPPTGSGTRFRFFFRTGTGGTFRARVIVVYKSRVLQTAVLTAPLDNARRSRRAKPASRIRLVVEAAVRPGMAGLSGRRSFGAAIVHNHAADGTASGTVVHDRHAVPLDLGGIGPTVSQITADLSSAAMDPDAYGPTLDAEATVRLLFRLAHHGVILHDDLFSRPKFKELVGNADRVQIVAADPNAVLPLEYVYDLPTPARPPKLCDNARTALIDGHCSPDNHHLDAEGHLDVVCPSGFWAMSRVIERHVADPEGVRRSGSAYSVDAEPVRGRNVLAGLSGAVFAASARVDAAVAGSAASVETALTDATGGHAIRVATWPEWVTEVGSRTPSLLVLLAHSARDDDTGQTVLEIEQDQRRDVSEINRKFIGPDGSHPIVLLLGCDTAVPELQYQTFVSRFRQLDAALVVGTVATVAGSHAARVAASLAQALHDADTSRQPAFGDLLLDVRRRLLADGEVMALSLTSYGDADWRFPA